MALHVRSQWSHHQFYFFKVNRSLDLISRILELDSKAREWFKSSEIEEKRRIITMRFQNVKMEGATLVLKPRKPFDRVIQNKKQSEWLGRKDSNPRMPGPKPGALPLGDSPMISGL